MLDIPHGAIYTLMGVVPKEGLRVLVAVLTILKEWDTRYSVGVLEVVSEWDDKLGTVRSSAFCRVNLHEPIGHAKYVWSRPPTTRACTPTNEITRGVIMRSGHRHWHG